MYHNCLVIYRYIHALVQAPLFFKLVKPVDDPRICTDIALAQHTIPRYHTAGGRKLADR